MAFSSLGAVLYSRRKRRDKKYVPRLLEKGYKANW